MHLNVWSCYKQVHLYHIWGMSFSQGKKSHLTSAKVKSNVELDHCPLNFNLKGNLQYKPNHLSSGPVGICCWRIFYDGELIGLQFISSDFTLAPNVGKVFLIIIHIHLAEDFPHHIKQKCSQKQWLNASQYYSTKTQG